MTILLDSINVWVLWWSIDSVKCCGPIVKVSNPYGIESWRWLSDKKWCSIYRYYCGVSKNKWDRRLNLVPRWIISDLLWLVFWLERYRNFPKRPDDPKSASHAHLHAYSDSTTTPVPMLTSPSRSTFNIQSWHITEGRQSTQVCLCALELLCRSPLVLPWHGQEHLSALSWNSCHFTICVAHDQARRADGRAGDTIFYHLHLLCIYWPQRFNL